MINYKKGTKPRCKYGHLFAGDNLAYSVTGARVCLTCRKKLYEARMERERAARILGPGPRRRAKQEATRTDTARPAPPFVDGNSDAGWRRLYGFKKKLTRP